jgi:hypothetical protein
MIKCEYLNITTIQYSQLQNLELMHQYELCSITTILVKGVLILFLIYFVYKNSNK